MAVEVGDTKNASNVMLWDVHLVSSGWMYALRRETILPFPDPQILMKRKKKKHDRQ